MTSILPAEQKPPLKQKKWTRQEYERAADRGVFGPDEHLELIEGVIVCKMTQNGPHVAGVYLTDKLLNRAFLDGFVVRSQAPFAIGDDSEPEPDLAVVVGNLSDYLINHPTTAELVVEVSDSTLSTDRTFKANLYARAGIREYWILNLRDYVLEVYRDPALLDGQRSDYGYQNVTTYTEADSLAPLAAPDFLFTVSELLPPRIP